jgi:UPF0716 family protein affecting phage T7 exclusion
MATKRPHILILWGDAIGWWPLATVTIFSSVVGIFAFGAVLFRLA